MFSGKKIILFPLLCMAMVFILSSIPGNGTSNVNFIQNIDPGLQNLLHVPLFGMLMLLWFFALIEYKLEVRQAILWAGVITVVYGILDEIHQFFVPGRYSGIGDVLLNCIGVFVVSFYIHRSRIRKLKRVK